MDTSLAGASAGSNPKGKKRIATAKKITDSVFKGAAGVIGSIKEEEDLGMYIRSSHGPFHEDLAEEELVCKM